MKLYCGLGILDGSYIYQVIGIYCTIKGEFQGYRKSSIIYRTVKLFDNGFDADRLVQNNFLVIGKPNENENWTMDVFSELPEKTEKEVSTSEWNGLFFSAWPEINTTISLRREMGSWVDTSRYDGLFR